MIRCRLVKNRFKSLILAHSQLQKDKHERKLRIKKIQVIFYIFFFYNFLYICIDIFIIFKEKEKELMLLKALNVNDYIQLNSIRSTAAAKTIQKFWRKFGMGNLKPTSESYSKGENHLHNETFSLLSKIKSSVSKSPKSSDPDHKFEGNALGIAQVNPIISSHLLYFMIVKHI